MVDGERGQGTQGVGGQRIPREPDPDADTGNCSADKLV